MDTELGVAPYRFSVEEFNKLGDVGIFDEDDRVELLDGEIIVMSPIGSKHAGTTMQIDAALRRQLGDRALFNLQNPAVLDDFSEPLPDITLLKTRRDFYKTAHPRPEDILLLIEVSDTTLAYDRGRKLRKYAERGVEEVWIVNVQANRIEQFRGPIGGNYSLSEEKERGDEITVVAFPGITFKVEELIG